MTVFFEDYAVGDRFELGEHTFTEEGITSFAESFDPQPFHLDRSAAADSHFDGLIASGWHTAAVSHRLAVEAMMTDAAVVAGVGVEDLQWRRPVRPGDTISGSVEVLEKSPAEHDSGRGNVTFAATITDQDDRTVLTYTSTAQFYRRP